MKKGTGIALVIVLLLITNAITGVTAFVGGGLSQASNLETGDSVVISKADYEYLQEVQNGVKEDVKAGDRVILSKEEYDKIMAYDDLFNDVSELREFILKNYYKDFDEDLFRDGVLKGLFDALGDPYSIYMNQEEYARFNESSEGSYGGIGIIVTPAEDGYITIVSPIEDTPGERAGLRTGDRIIKVGDQEFTSETMDDAVKLMRGIPGEPVTITIARKGQDPFEVTIVREEIRLKSVKSRMLNDDMGYLRISAFDLQTSDDFDAHLDEVLKQNPKGLVIDLRNNPGGSLREVVEISDRLLGKQMIVYTKNRVGKQHDFTSDARRVDLPMVVLINGGSASASEIMAGAIQDTKAGVVIGTKSFGKGVVQTVFDHEGGAGFKLTTSEYFTPNGRNIHGVGIEPDVVIEQAENYEDIEEPTDQDDVQLMKAIEILQEQIGE